MGTLPEATAERLAVVRQSGALVEFLDEALAHHVISIADYPVLAGTTWNRTDKVIPAREAFALYERNWRFVRGEKLTVRETQLLDRLTGEFGNGASEPCGPGWRLPRKPSTAAPSSRSLPPVSTHLPLAVRQQTDI